AAAGTELPLPDDMRVTLLGQSRAPNAWPITHMTWLLAYTNQAGRATGIALVRYLWWATHDGQQDNARLGYAPLSLAMIARNETLISKFTANGKSVLRHILLITPATPINSPN